MKRLLRSIAIVLGAAGVVSVYAAGRVVTINAHRATFAAHVAEAYLSFNVEMVQVVDGDFWGPIGGELRVPDPPLDFPRGRLRNLTGELAPAIMRVSGTGANSTFYDFSSAPVDTPPPGFSYVLTREQWDAANRFALDLGLGVLPSIGVSAGTRDVDRTWTDDNFRVLLEHSVDQGYPLAGLEFMNEPSMGSSSGLPPNYSAHEYARDFETFVSTRDALAPDVPVVAPSVFELPFPIPPGLFDGPEVEEIMARVGSDIDIVAYHFYPALSARCLRTTTPEQALEPLFLFAGVPVAALYEGLRDQFSPGVPVHLNENAQAACGGDEWASTFIDTFRFLNQLGLLAQRGHDVVYHNTLTGASYGLLLEPELETSANYWGAVLWKRLMGTRSLEPSATPIPNVYVYAHCSKNGRPGSVTTLVLNADRDNSAKVRLQGRGSLVSFAYVLTAPDLLGRTVELNAKVLAVRANGSLPDLVPELVLGKRGVRLPPTSIAFIVQPFARAAACRVDELAQ